MAETQQQQRKVAAPPINSETQHFWDMAGHHHNGNSRGCFALKESLTDLVATQIRQTVIE